MQIAEHATVVFSFVIGVCLSSCIYMSSIIVIYVYSFFLSRMSSVRSSIYTSILLPNEVALVVSDLGRIAHLSVGSHTGRLSSVLRLGCLGCVACLSLMPSSPCVPGQPIPSHDPPNSPTQPNGPVIPGMPNKRRSGKGHPSFRQRGHQYLSKNRLRDDAARHCERGFPRLESAVKVVLGLVGEGENDVVDVRGEDVDT